METGLLNLKAILQKKREEASVSTAETDTAFYSALKLRGEEESKSKKELNLRPSCKETEDPRLLTSKSVLEQKAALYEKLKSGTEALEHDELNEKFLINFQEKIRNEVKAKRIDNIDKPEVNADENCDYNATEEGEEWIEYTDSLGRSRMCQKKDLEKMREIDSQILGFDVKNLNKKDEHLEDVRQKWREIEEETKFKKDLHYQDVLFDEARSHGVGYMNFSRNEEVRHQQFELLKEFKEESAKAKELNASIKTEKEKLMADRLAKVRQKKRLKMGLPTISIEEIKLNAPWPIDEEKKPQDTKPETTIEPSISSSMESKVREWDIGKCLLTMRSDKSPMTQEEWISSRRKVRDTEFQPPGLYSNKVKPYSSSKKGMSYTSNNYNSKTKNSRQNIQSDEKNVSNCEKRRIGPEIPPPPTYDYFGPPPVKFVKSDLRKTFGQSLNIEESIEKGLAYLRKQS